MGNHVPSTRTTQPEVAESAPLASGAWNVVLIVLAGEVLDLLDSLVTTIAGPTIMRDLGGSQEFIQWLSAGYTVAMAAGLLIGGRLGDMFGRKRMFLVGMAGFTTTSLVSALAANPQTLITARVLQGLLGALMLPQALGLIKEVFPPEKVGVAFGVTGPVMALSGVAGPIVAGWLVDADYFGWSWRMIFAVNIPIGLAALGFGAALLPRSRPEAGLTIDVGGAALASAGMAGLVFALVQGRGLGWPWWVFAVLAAGVGALVLFALHQIRRGARGRSTLVVPSLFGKRAFVAGSSIGVLFFSALTGMALLYSLLFQLGLGLSPLRSGLATLAQAVGMVVGFGLSQALGVMRRTMIIGFLVVIAGQAAFIGTLAAQGHSVSAWWLSPALALVGIGMGLAVAPFFDIVLSGVEHGESGSASGTLTAVQQVGSALGVSVLGTIFFAVWARQRGEGVLAFSHAASLAIGVAIALVAVACLLTLLLPHRPQFGAAAEH